MPENQSATQTVFIVDDDPALRLMIANVLEAGGYHTSCFASGTEFLRVVDCSTKGCAVVDLRLPDISGLELQERLAEVSDALSFILISGYAKVDTAVAAMRLGAVDVIEKPFNQQQLLDSVKAALDRSEDLSRQISEEDGVLGRVGALTARERQVFELMLAGDSSKRIAKQLGISRKTVEVHRSRIRSKLQFESITELAQISIVYGRGINRQRLPFSAGAN